MITQLMSLLIQLVAVAMIRGREIMAHVLTWDTTNISSVTVNGTAVSQPYTLQDGDVIEFYSITLTVGGVICNIWDSDGGNLLEQYDSFDSNTNIFSLSNTNLYITAGSASGGSN